MLFTNRSFLFVIILLVCTTTLNAQFIDLGVLAKGSAGDSSRYTIAERMEFYKVPGTSVTIFEQGKILSHQVYGFSSSTAKTALDTSTRFQAASVSKSVTAVAVLHTAEHYQLDLDRNVNDYLKSWKVPENRFTKNEKVTIRRLLSHTAGINVSGFGGYRKGSSIPFPEAILNGKGNTPAVNVTEVPGKKYMYSGGGYMILQQLVEDITGISFGEYVRKEILDPLGMTSSTFEYAPETNISLAHTDKGEPYPGGYYLMPESAPAGLWTTGADLARFCITLQQAYEGTPNSIITHSMVKAMLTTTGTYGLGLGAGGKGNDVYFYHGGKNRGYNSVFLNLYKRRLGIVILTNADQGDKFRDEILRSFARYYKLNIMGNNGL
ncbi:serine hydrolase domain-containing protein [Sediminibacterium ginsengisoli]|nr:serine hydrolase domain-containing protein [Sediminibacterium ginsengisoli]